MGDPFSFFHRRVESANDTTSGVAPFSGLVLGHATNPFRIEGNFDRDTQGSSLLATLG